MPDVTSCEMKRQNALSNPLPISQKGCGYSLSENVSALGDDN